MARPKKKKKVKRWINGIVLLIVFALLLYFIPSQLPGPLQPMSEALHQAVHTMESWFDPNPKPSEEIYPVVWVFDGDTILVRIEEKEVTIRMIGIDAPESVHQDETKNTPEGGIASAWLKEYLKGKSVALEYDRELTDQYGRTLAYVYLNDELVEDAILKAGMARTMILEPNVKYEKHLMESEREAQKNGAGFWGTGFFQE